MNRASSTELSLHFSILEKKKNAFPKLTESYYQPLLDCLIRWYGKNINHDLQLTHEAVFESMKYYFDHPRTYDPACGTLQKFLEISADRTIQTIFEREKCPIRPNGIDHLLSRHLDNERDIQLAKLILKKKTEMATFIYLLDLGNYRIHQQQQEIKRHTERIKRVLSSFQYSFELSGFKVRKSVA